MSDSSFTEATRQARELLDALTKPPGSLGQLEEVAAQLAGIARSCPPPVPSEPWVAVFAADHGVVRQGVGVWPKDVTAAMVRTMAGGRAAVNAIARTVGAGVRVVDVGVDADLGNVDGIVHAKVRAGTDDLADGPAMTLEQAGAALTVGTETARDLIAAGGDCLVGGEMGIGNTTAATCLVAAFTGRPAVELVGSGAGETSRSRAAKEAVVTAAVERVRSHTDDPLRVLAEVGGLEIAALAGFFAAGVGARVPVVIDGAIAVAALLVADALEPGLRKSCIAGHLSTEPVAAAGLGHLGMRPLLDLDMRLGEGTGGCLAVPLLQAAARCMGEMARLAELG